MWTTTDRDNVKQALLDLAMGKRRVRVSYSSDAGGSTVEYGEADMPQLKTLLREIDSALGGRRRTFHPTTHR